MNRHDWTPSRRRSWGERYPVLLEIIGATASIILVCSTMLLAVYKF